MADILEVLHGLLSASDRTWEQLETARVTKRMERGGFDDRLWLISTDPI